MKRWLVDRAGAMTLAIAVLYIALAPTWIVDGDNAEFATLAAVGGRAHPTGYPLYVLWLRATSWLPGSSPAHTAAIATAILAAAQVFVLHAACRAWGARTLAASVATGIFALAPVVLRMHTEAEVFALNGLVLATILLLSATAGPLRGVARGAVLGLVAGLGIANHVTCVVIAPVGLLGVVRGVRESRRSIVAIVAALGGLVVGLAPYLYMFVAPDAASWGRVDDVRDLLSFVLRYDYGGPGSFATHSRGVDIGANLGALAATIGRSWCWVLAIVGVTTLGWRAARRQPAGESRVAWGALAASWLVAGPLLVARFNIPPRGLGLYVVERFHIFPTLLLVIPVAVGLDAMARRTKIVARPAMVWSGVIAVMATLALLAMPRLLAEHSRAMDAGVRNTLDTFPDHAIVLVASEDQCLGMRYLQLAEDDRPDVEVVCWLLMSRDWYRLPIIARGVPFGASTGGPASISDGEAILATGRPLFVDEIQHPILETFRAFPQGVFFRVLPRGTRVPSIHDVVADNRALYQRFDLGARPDRGDDYAAVAFLRYAFIWRTLAAAADSAGEHDDAAFSHEMEDELTPR